MPLLVTHNRNGLIRYVTPQPQPANHLHTTQGKERTTTTTATKTQQKGGDIGTHTPQCTIMDNTKEGQRDIKPVCVWGQTGNNTNTQREGDNTTGEKEQPTTKKHSQNREKNNNTTRRSVKRTQQRSYAQILCTFVNTVQVRVYTYRFSTIPTTSASSIGVSNPSTF